jgi:hypothetical protein
MGEIEWTKMNQGFLAVLEVAFIARGEDRIGISPSAMVEMRRPCRCCSWARISLRWLPVGMEGIRSKTWQLVGARGGSHLQRRCGAHRRRVAPATEEKTKMTTSSAYSKRYEAGWFQMGCQAGPAWLGFGPGKSFPFFLFCFLFYFLFF